MLYGKLSNDINAKIDSFLAFGTLRQKCTNSQFQTIDAKKFPTQKKLGLQTSKF